MQSEGVEQSAGKVPYCVSLFISHPLLTVIQVLTAEINDLAESCKALLVVLRINPL